MNPRSGRPGALALALCLALAGCVAGGDSSLPPVRSLGWFNHLAGSDIRNACGSVAGNRYRLVYNAVWGEQVRDYEIAEPQPARGGELTAHVFFPQIVNALDLRDPLAGFRGQRSAVALAPDQLAAFRAALHASGFDEPAPQGLVLPSDGYYWVAAACERGVFHFNAWNHPSPRFAAAGFAAWLFQHDATGVPVRPPQPVPPRQPTGGRSKDQPVNSIFDMVVGANGLVGVAALPFRGAL